MKVRSQDSSTSRTTPWKEHGRDLELRRVKRWCPERCTAKAWPLAGHWKRGGAPEKLAGPRRGAPQKRGPRRGTGTRSGPWNKSGALEKRAGPRMFRGGAGPFCHHSALGPTGSKCLFVPVQILYCYDFTCHTMMTFCEDLESGNKHIVCVFPIGHLSEQHCCCQIRRDVPQ